MTVEWLLWVLLRCWPMEVQMRRGCEFEVRGCRGGGGEEHGEMAAANAWRLTVNLEASDIFAQNIEQSFSMVRGLSHQHIRMLRTSSNH